MIQIRQNTFETNSSSSHSITINNDKRFFKPELPIVECFTDANGVEYPNAVVLTGGQWGWEQDQYTDAYNKANYLAVWLTLYNKNEELKAMFIKVIKKHIKADNVVFDIIPDGIGYTPGQSYIDHQSIDVASEAFESANTLENYLFNSHSILITDNDNH